MYLSDLTPPISKLKGVGPATAEDFTKLGVTTLADLLSLSPREYDDRSVVTGLDGVSMDNNHINTTIKVLSHTYFGSHEKGKRTLKIRAQDTESGQSLSLLCFGREFLSRTMYPGTLWYINGTVTRFSGEWQSSSFTVTSEEEKVSKGGFGKILPVYPLSGNLNQNTIRKAVQLLLSNKMITLDDDMPSYIYEKYHLMHTDEAVRKLHFPSTLAEAGEARRSLAFSELLYMELNIRRGAGTPPPENKKARTSELEKRFIASLPFSLTPDQKSALEDIRRDMDYTPAMNRLLQGDVGSGKTLVAWISALHIIAEGGQVAFMAPTELLARQHAEKAAELLEGLGVRVAFITGDVKGSGRKLLLKALASGEADIAIGTHALFSKDVVFKNLKYVIIDEQHRFGVEQRLALTAKGEVPHVLLMTATPIPRTLALTLFGDLCISTIKTMPEGRKSIITYTVLEDNREKMYRTIEVEFRRGHQAYFVYPRISDEGESDLRDVNNMFTFLKKEYPDVPSALIHSKLPEEEKMKILSDFRAKKIMYLVSTSVVEVGIDIPDATCMVIEHADRFGLAALHQLRGRVGRSTLQSYCFLVFGKNLSDDAKARIKVMKNSTDGFYIAEQDLLIRGPGEMAGSRQSGFLRLRYASLVNDVDLLADAKEEAEAILQKDRGLISSENYMLRQLINREEDKTTTI